MWKINKLSAYEIVDDKNRVITSGLDETQAKAICDTHNEQISNIKWDKGKNTGGERH